MGELIDKLRTRLRDMAFGRTKLQVVSTGDEKYENLCPFFLVTTFRSGSTFLRLLLNSHSAVCCPPETKFLVHLANMRADPVTEKALDSLGFSTDYVRRQLRAVASGFYGPHLQAAGKPVLVDKTPDYVRILDFIDWLYEEKTKFIVLFRNGLDVAQSMNETPLDPFDEKKNLQLTFEYWKTDAQLMLNWLSLHPDRCHTVLYEELCDDLEGEMRKVLDFLGLPWEESVREWFKTGHERGHEDIKARRQRGVNKRFGTYEHWDQSLIQEFKAAAKVFHEAMGYDSDTLRPRRS
ncbi:MAG: sulfotransferase family protein [Gammaproteobacteria bacterium]